MASAPGSFGCPVYYSTGFDCRFNVIHYFIRLAPPTNCVVFHGSYRGLRVIYLPISPAFCFVVSIHAPSFQKILVGHKQTAARRLHRPALSAPIACTVLFAKLSEGYCSSCYAYGPQIFSPLNSSLISSPSFSSSHHHLPLPAAHPPSPSHPSQHPSPQPASQSPIHRPPAHSDPPSSQAAPPYASPIVPDSLSVFRLPLLCPSCTSDTRLTRDRTSSA